MALGDLIARRYSCRSYTDTPVDPAMVDELIDTARMAPSAKNFQEWRFVVVDERDRINELTDKAGSQPWWRSAPVMIVVCAETDKYVMRGGQLCYPIDCAIIIDHITLLATEKGLATCWVGSYDEDAVKRICAIPDHIRVVELVTLGYPADTPRPKSRLPLDHIRYRQVWGQASRSTTG